MHIMIKRARSSRLVYRSVGVALVVVLLAGCGFHLRGSVALPESLSPLRLEGVEVHEALREELVTLLRAGSVRFAAGEEAPAAVLVISGYRQLRRVLSVDRRGKAAEVELSQSLRFSLMDGARKPLLEPQQLRVQRSYLHSSVQVLAKQDEEAMLRSAMRRDLAQQVVTRIRSAQR